MSDDRRPLHDRWPTLAAALPHTPLATLPTPLEMRRSPLGPVLCKLEGATNDAYGGNKVRKLEYALAQAHAHGCGRVATFGAAGSNHATATAVHAHAQGLECVTFLSRQRPTPWIADNLRRQLTAGAQIVFVDGNRQERERQARAHLDRLEGRTWLVPMGGSSVAGTLGYVNAGLELAEQLVALPADNLPDRLYVPLGTMGTAVGLVIGLALAGVETPVHAVRVVHESVGSASGAERHFAKTVRLLTTLDRRVPHIAFRPERFVTRNSFFGNGYAAVTRAAQDAMAFARRHLDLSLETTYSAKTLAACLADAESSDSPKTPLFVSTYQHGAPVPPVARDAPLPDALASYLHAG